MFQITIQDKTYTVNFNHYPSGTECFIVSGKSTGRIDKTRPDDVVSVGASWIVPPDSPCKAIGRKLSLSRALLDEKDGQHIFDKPTRTLFWNRYHELSRGTK